MGTFKVALLRFRDVLGLHREPRAAGLADGTDRGSVEVRRGALRWRRVLGAAALITVATYGLMLQFVTFLVAMVNFVITQARLEVPEASLTALTLGIGYAGGHFAGPAAFFLLCLGVALRHGRRSGTGAALHGAVVGAVAALMVQAVGFLLNPELLVWELVVYPVLGIGGGFLGGMRGWAARAGEEALHEASQDVAAARSARAVATAIGERLAGTRATGVSVWESRGAGDLESNARDGAFFEVAGSWVPERAGGPSARPWPPGSRLDPAGVPQLRGMSPGAVKEVSVGGLPPVGRAALEGRGASSVLLVPLSGPGGAWDGLLVVESRRGFSAGARRAYATVGAQAAPALESLHLVEEARRAGLLGERRRMAGEIHDTLAQNFTSIVTNLEAAESALYSADPKKTRRHLDRARGIAREGLTEARRLVRALKPRLLEDAALPDAISRLAGGWSEASGVAVACTTTGPVRPLPSESESVLFRAAQEALTNVDKHARAGRAAVTLSYVGDRVVLDVLDDGSGFDPAADGGGRGEGGFGLASMRERIEALGGTLTVESAPGEGTTLTVELPVGTSSSGQRIEGRVGREAS